MRRRWRWLLLVPVVAGAVLASVHVLARGQMREMAAKGEGTSKACTMCHGPKGEAGGGGMQAHAAPWALASAAQGRVLFAAATGTGEIARIDAERGRLERRFTVDAIVRGLAVSPGGLTLAAGLSNRDEVALLHPHSGEVQARIAVGRGPAGVAFDASGERLFVANTRSSDVSVVDVAARREVRRLPAGREPFAVRADPTGATVAVVSRRTELGRPSELPYSLVTLLDAADGSVRHSVRLPSCHMAEDAVFTADGRQLLVPAILARNRLPILQVERGWVMSSVLAVVDVATGAVVLLPLTEANEGFPDPSGIALSPDGTRAYVACGGRDQVAELDVPALLAVAREADAGQVHRLSVSRRYLLRRIPVGANPRALLWVGESDGRLAVSERLEDAVALLDVRAGGLRRVELTGYGTLDPVQRGARNFHSARFAFQHAFSCRSCHPDGHTDGLTYDFDIDGVGRNIVLNRSLQGVAGTAPFKWAGTNPSLKHQCGPRFAMVLTRADPMSDEELGHLVAYLHSLRAPPPDPQAGRIGGVLTGARERGKRIFERDTRKDGTPIPPSGRCITCHPPPLFSTRMTSDVGTQGPGDKTGLFDTPHLIGIGSKAPYLHDGRALTLEEIWTAEGVGDKHGVVSDLNKADLNDLVEYMKGL